MYKMKFASRTTFALLMAALAALAPVMSSAAATTETAATIVPNIIMMPTAASEEAAADTYASGDSSGVTYAAAGGVSFMPASSSSPAEGSDFEVDVSQYVTASSYVSGSIGAHGEGVATTFYDGSLSRVTVSPSATNVRWIGRTAFRNNILYFANSGSGCEFTFYGDYAAIQFIGDTHAITGQTDRQARIGIYVNGLRVVDTMIDSAEKTVEVIKSDTPATYTVRVVKLSEPAFSFSAIKGIEVNSSHNTTPTEPKPRLIEFIGDSITCGYGLDDSVENDAFTTRTEDVTGSYAWLTAQALDYDISTLSYSGAGILSGNVVLSGEYVVPKNVSQYYKKIGFSNSGINYHYPQIMNWDFPDRANIVVLNLGTNDIKYIRAGENTTADFEKEYVKFLERIREHNPDALILCTLGIMGDDLYDNIVNAVETFKAATYDQRVFTMKFDAMAPEDGCTIHQHPTRETNRKAAEQLLNTINYYKSIMLW